jgi:hypothetical protein
LRGFTRFGRGPGADDRVGVVVSWLMPLFSVLFEFFQTSRSCFLYVCACSSFVLDDDLGDLKCAIKEGARPKCLRR